MFGGAQFVPRRSTEAGAPIKNRDQEQSGEGRSRDQVPNLQKSLFVPQLVMDNSEQSRLVAQHLYDRRHCVGCTARKPSQTKWGTFPYPHAPHPYNHQERRTWWRVANGALCQESQLRSRQCNIPLGEEIDWKMDCYRLPSIPHGADHGVQGYDEKLGSQVPRLWEEGDHCRGGNCFAGAASQFLLV